MTFATRHILLLCIVGTLAGCREQQSALHPESVHANSVATLGYVLFIGATVIFVFVAILTLYALYAGRSTRGWLSREATVFAGGVIFPVVTLSALLFYGLKVTAADPAGSATPSAGTVTITVTGERWWWRVHYRMPDGSVFETANEVRIPVDTRIDIELKTADVIHSFWVPQLAGKIDMIPGRTNHLTLVASRPGIHRGQCAEYCGGAHALMSFFVVALTKGDFEAWRQTARGNAMPPSTQTQRRGQAAFLANGCGGCHTIRGTPARGSIGPDLTHVAQRRSLAAATLGNDVDTLARWIRFNQQIKPENLMLPYHHMAPEEARAIALYLASLE